MLTTMVAATIAAAVRKLDGKAQRHVESSGKPAFVMVIPEECTNLTCGVLSKFWEDLAEAAPDNVCWRVDCGKRSRNSLCKQISIVGATEPQVLVWHISEHEWRPYAGERSSEALALAVRNAIMGVLPSADVDDNSRGAAIATAQSSPPATSEAARTHCTLKAFRKLLDRAAFAAAAAADFDAASDARDAADCSAGSIDQRPPLRPSDVLPAPVYSSFAANSSIDLPGGPQAVAEGEIRWPPPMNVASRFAVLPGLVRADEVNAIRALVDDDHITFDADPDR